ncbi:MAG: 4Fe-4S binding protein [Bacteroidales bacterium]|nr:4Fe-4S binding protein [Bacteroidales bacterium]
MNKKLLKTIRITLGSICFALITLLLLDFTGTLRRYLTFMAKIQFLPAVMALNAGVIIALIVLTLVFGRIYCSVICPLGVFQDAVSHIHGLKKKNRFTFNKEIKWLRYGVWALFIIAMIAGVNSFVALLAPYSSWGRMVQNLFQPLYIWVNNFFAFLAEKADSYAFYSKDVWIRSISTFVIAAVSFLVITFVAWKTGRGYCNAVCPVGTTLSFFSRFSFLKIHIDADKCIKCDKCTKNCKSNCINGKEHFVDYSRCVVCGNCQAVCPKDAISYSRISNKMKKTQNVTDAKENKINESKRAFLFSSALMGTTLAFAQEKKKTDGGLAVIEDKKPYKRTTEIVPPGAKSLKNLQNKCTGCQLCVSKCPNNVLRPSSDLLHLMQPVMSFEKGACRVECTTCSSVCPAGAIQKITKEEKTAIQIGVAKWVKQNCVVVNNDHNCGNCARHCPSGAIIMVPYFKPNADNANMEVQNSTAALDKQDDKQLMIPTVNESRCIGCGMCEYVCPSRPFSAIYVEGMATHKNV